jgi:hypothetical protein
MKTDFSKHIICEDGHDREFHFARVNSAAIYYHVSVIDTDGKLITATLFIDENGKWKIQPEDFPAWLYGTEPKLAQVIEKEEKQAI